MKQIPQVLMLACGALSREIEALKRQNQMDCWTVRYLPASWHNLPHKIPPVAYTHLPLPTILLV